MKNYTITVNGVSYEVTVEEKSNTSNAFHSTENFVSKPSSEPSITPKLVYEEKVQAPTLSQTNNQSSGTKKVEAPMPGKILAVKTSVGQSIKRGDVLFILEAMKLENEIVASEEGIIASIHVLAGDMIESGVILATFN